MLLAEIPAEKHASTFLRPGVIGDGAEPALGLVSKRLELRHEIADTGAEAFECHRDADAAVLDALDEAGLFEVRQ